MASRMHGGQIWFLRNRKERVAPPGHRRGADGPGWGRGRVALLATGRATRASDRRQGARDRLATRLG
eukprot:365845-Chlamydomonas_euryale.AAC.7